MLYLLHGFIASGKTTLAKRLENEMNFIRITIDEWISRLYGIDPSQDVFDISSIVLKKQLEPLWEKILILGGHVILDYGFWSRSERMDIESKINDMGIEYSWIFLDTPIEECRNRNSIRNQSSSKVLEISDVAFLKYIEKFEPINNTKNNVINISNVQNLPNKLFNVDRA